MTTSLTNASSAADGPRASRPANRPWRPAADHNVRHRMTSEFLKDLWMLQETLNGFFKVGSDQVRRRDIRLCLDPTSDSLFNALQDWESKGFIAMITDPRRCREKDVCLRILKPIHAELMPDGCE